MISTKEKEQILIHLGGEIAPNGKDMACRDLICSLANISESISKMKFVKRDLQNLSVDNAVYNPDPHIVGEIEVAKILLNSIYQKLDAGLEQVKNI